MAQPKRRWSKARTHSKRSTWKKENPTYTSCPHCHEPVMPHRACKNCGYYDGKEVISKKETENAYSSSTYLKVLFYYIIGKF